MKALLPQNPHDNGVTPIILLPTDILKHLPIVDDIRLIKKVAGQNDSLRRDVSQHIQSIWTIKSRKDKEAALNAAMESAASFQTFLDLVKILEKQPYDFFKDPEGLIVWRGAARNTVALNPLALIIPAGLNEEEKIDFVCQKIITQFQHLIEDRRLNRLLWVDNKPRPEKFAQLLFLGIATAYCESNNLDIAPEADAGAGPVDFKISNGGKRVLIEIKLSTNNAVVKGFTHQLDAYLKAEKTHLGHYVLIDVGKLKDKWKSLQGIQKSDKKFSTARRIHLIDGNLRDSASKLR